MWRVGVAIGIAAVAYIMFVFMPGFCAFFSVSKRRTGTRLTEEAMKGTYYEPFKDRILAASKRIRELPGERMEITARDGVTLVGHYIDCRSEKTILFAHGYKADYIDQLSVAGELFYDMGYNLMFICHRAHGESGGKYTSLGILEQYDILNWVDELKQRGCDNILLYGMSMGCAAISYVADRLGEMGVRGLILDCGYDSPRTQMIEDCRKWHIPRCVLFPAMSMTARLVLGINMRDSVKDSLKKAMIPALFLHGEADESVKICFGRENYEVYGGPKEAYFVPGAAHTVSLLAGGETAVKYVNDFIQKYNL